VLALPADITSSFTAAEEALRWLLPPPLLCPPPLTWVLLAPLPRLRPLSMLPARLPGRTLGLQPPTNCVDVSSLYIVGAFDVPALELL